MTGEGRGGDRSGGRRAGGGRLWWWGAGVAGVGGCGGWGRGSDGGRIRCGGRGRMDVVWKVAERGEGGDEWAEELAGAEVAAVKVEAKARYRRK